jgi:hypothetical protein
VRASLLLLLWQLADFAGLLLDVEVELSRDRPRQAEGAEVDGVVAAFAAGDGEKELFGEAARGTVPFST